MRARAALAVGRVGLPQGIEPLTRCWPTPSVDVRQMAAFALGLIGDAAARPALLPALDDAVADRPGTRGGGAWRSSATAADADGDAAMVQAHVKAGALAGVRARRSDVSAGAADRSRAARASTRSRGWARTRRWRRPCSTRGGQPVSRWWPVAYALQRIGEAAPRRRCSRCSTTPAGTRPRLPPRGWATCRPPAQRSALRQIVEQRAQARWSSCSPSGRCARWPPRRPPSRRCSSGSSPTRRSPTLRLRGDDRVRRRGRPRSTSICCSICCRDPAPASAARAMRALARVDPDAFIVDARRPRRRRATGRSASRRRRRSARSRPSARLPRLTRHADDRDQRVVPAVLAALAASQAAGCRARCCVERLRRRRLRRPGRGRHGARRLEGRDGRAGARRRPIAAASGDDDLRRPCGRARRRSSSRPAGGASAARGGADGPRLGGACPRGGAAAGAGRDRCVAERYAAGDRRPAVDDPEWQRIVSPPYSPHGLHRDDAARSRWSWPSPTRR